MIYIDETSSTEQLRPNFWTNKHTKSQNYLVLHHYDGLTTHGLHPEACTADQVQHSQAFFVRAAFTNQTPPSDTRSVTNVVFCVIWSLNRKKDKKKKGPTTDLNQKDKAVVEESYEDDGTGEKRSQESADCVFL